MQCVNFVLCFVNANDTSDDVQLSLRVYVSCSGTCAKSLLK